MFGLYGGTILVCAIAGLVFFPPVELYLAGVVHWAHVSEAQLLPLALCAAGGQMIAKVTLYFAGKGLLEAPRGRWKAKIEQARAKIATWEKKPYYIYALSAVFGIPPYFLVAVASGAMKIRFVPFLTIGFAGRLLRFGTIIVATYYGWGHWANA
jgi:membrane protein YqaA with SNARE-associated domain